MSYQKVIASLVVIALLSLSFVNIQSAISSPSSFRERAEQKEAAAEARAAARKARILERIEAIKNRRKGNDGGEPPPLIGSSWQPVKCDDSPPCVQVDNTASFVESAGQLDLLVQINPHTPGACNPDMQGFLILLPEGTPAGTVSFEKVLEAGSLAGLYLTVTAWANTDGTGFFAGETHSIANGLLSSGSEESFDFQNHPPNVGSIAPPGSTMRLVYGVVQTPNSNPSETFRLRIRNLRVNGLAIENAVFQTTCPPGFL